MTDLKSKNKQPVDGAVFPFTIKFDEMVEYKECIFFYYKNRHVVTINKESKEIYSI